METDTSFTFMTELDPQPRYSLFTHGPFWKKDKNGVWYDGHGYQKKCPYGEVGDAIPIDFNGTKINCEITDVGVVESSGKFFWCISASGSLDWMELTKEALQEMSFGRDG